MTEAGAEHRDPDGAAGGALAQELRRLTGRGELSADAAARIWAAAEADRRESPDRGPSRAGSTGVLDVLGYVGGALLLGALVFVGFTLWGDLSRAGKTALAVASCLVPAAGGVVLVRSRTRRALALTLLDLASVAAGFACYMLIDDRDLIVSAAVIVLAAAAGAVLLRSPAFYLPGWFGAMGLVIAVVTNGLELPEGNAVGYAMSGGFLLVAGLFVGAGLLLGRPVAWTFAGLSGWAATGPLLSFEQSLLGLLLGTAVAAALFVGLVRLQVYAFAVVGCLIVLSIWPTALYQLLDTALGVALGLVAAGCALIAGAVVLARHRRHRTAWSGRTA